MIGTDSIVVDMRHGSAGCVFSTTFDRLYEFYYRNYILSFAGPPFTHQRKPEW
jgi:hypothetical protein